MISKQDYLRRKEMWDSTVGVIRDFFNSNDFIEVQTPLLVLSPDMDPNTDPFEITLKSNNPKRKISAALITSPEFSMKKLLGSGFEKIYTITKVFRNNESLSGLHSPEFTMLEWYATGDYRDCMAQTEELVNKVLEDNRKFKIFPHRKANFDDFGEPHVESNNFFVIEYPKNQSALARLTPDKKFAERFEAYVDGVELCNGFSELIDSSDQRKRFDIEQEKRRKEGKSVFPIDQDLLDALDQIKNPIYGNALGLDRLIMLRYGVKDINEIQLFPVKDIFKTNKD